MREADEKRTEKRLELDQVDAARHSAFLTESRILAHNFDDPSRVRRDHYKGMSTEELADIQRQQQEQREELAERRAAKVAEDRAWAARVQAQVAAAREMDADTEAERVADQRQYYLDIKAQQRAAKLAYVAACVGGGCGCGVSVCLCACVCARAHVLCNAGVHGGVGRA